MRGREKVKRESMLNCELTSIVSISISSVVMVHSTLGRNKQQPMRRLQTKPPPHASDLLT